MTPDGLIDYRPYTRPELENAMRNIDSQRYPQNFANLRRELDSRPLGENPPRTARNYERLIEVVGWIQFAGAAILANQLLQADHSTGFTDWRPLAVMALILVMVAVSAIGGICLVKRKPIGVPLSVAALVAQSISVKTSGLAYQYLPAVGFQLYWTPSNFGFNGLIGPDVILTIGGTYDTRVAIDVLALYLAYVIGTKRRSSNTVG